MEVGEKQFISCEIYMSILNEDGEKMECLPYVRNLKEGRLKMIWILVLAFADWGNKG